jgi:hypothetical protein
MKVRYWIAIIVLVIIAATAVYYTGFSCWAEKYPRLGDAVQIVGVFAALATAIVALSTADPKKGRVKVNISLSIDEEAKHPQSELSDELKKYYIGFPDPVRSHRVQFKMTNNSGFTLKKPTLTFRIPIHKKHPHRFSNEKPWSLYTFNSNLYNYKAEFRTLEFANTSVLSNSNLPYWNDKEEIMLWIRMVLDDGKLEPFAVEVSVNCENAEGVTEKVEIKPKALLKTK